MENPHVFTIAEEKNTVISKICHFPFKVFAYIVSGAYRESPRRTCKWNLKKFDKYDSEKFWDTMMYKVKGRPKEMKADDRRRFMQICGGWKHYVVFEPSDMKATKRWFVGWKHNGEVTVINIPITGDIRMLIGPGDVKFLAVDADTGRQVKIRRTGEGDMGSGKHPKIPLQ